ncbi:MAG: 3-deoxy-D-manno-octulosonic acid transferase [Calditerrivibrio sp.]|nr:3-deoxy-D-manno-octulosonic acid transferase [Calditerrivibrio sp.]
MLSFIYNLCLHLIIPLALPLGYIFAYKRGEDKDYFERFGFIKIEKDLKNSMWIHCASVGEVRSIKGFVKLLKKDYPEMAIVISTITATGKKIALEEINPDVAFLLPIENRWAISHLLDLLNCRLFILVDTEIWPNLINVVSKKVPIFIINGRLSDKSFRRYLLFKFVFKKLLNKVTKIYAKSDEDRNRFVRILEDSSKVNILSNIKYLNMSAFVDLNIIPNGKRILIAGSTHADEEEIILDSFMETFDDDLFDQVVIAPRHLNRVNEVVDICVKKGLKVSFLSNYNPESDVVIVDRFGCLEYLYNVSLKVFIGGSLVRIGGHNIFEAIQFKKVVSVGPYMENFKEVYDLAKMYGLVVDVYGKDDLVRYYKTEYNLENFERFIADVEHIIKNRLEPLFKDIRDVIS